MVTRAAAGLVARRHGAALEAWLTMQHDRAITKGLLARMAHVGAPSTPHVVNGRLGRDQRGRMLAAITGTGPADFQGQLPAARCFCGCGAVHGGRAVAIEAKSREGRLTREEIAEHQRADLDACAAGGGLAVLVARLDGVVHAIPWREVPWCSPRGGSPSIGAADVAAWRIDARCDAHVLDAEWSFYLLPLVGVAAMRGGSV